MANVMMGLGPFRFEIGTAAYQTLERSDEYRWVAQDRIGRQPAMQNLGPGLTTFNLSGIIYPHFRGGLGQLDRMREVAGRGTPQMMASGLGRIFGLFVILTVDETQTIFFDNGKPRKVEFALEIKSYGPDGTGGLLT
jgi:phage protein U